MKGRAGGGRGEAGGRGKDGVGGRGQSTGCRLQHATMSENKPLTTVTLDKR